MHNRIFIAIILCIFIFVFDALFFHGSSNTRHFKILKAIIMHFRGFWKCYKRDLHKILYDTFTKRSQNVGKVIINIMCLACSAKCFHVIVETPFGWSVVIVMFIATENKNVYPDYMCMVTFNLSWAKKQKVETSWNANALWSEWVV